MGRAAKLLLKILKGVSDNNILFDQLCQLLVNLGFEQRVRGSHHIFTQDGIHEIINIQPKGSQAKAYQVRQIRGLILKYKLGDQHDAL
ncbi:MAG: type II toxin-antitoxin system HicA family toxin [Pseudanabaena sp.]